MLKIRDGAVQNDETKLIASAALHSFHMQRGCLHKCLKGTTEKGQFTIKDQTGWKNCHDKNMMNNNKSPQRAVLESKKI